MTPAPPQSAPRRDAPAAPPEGRDAWDVLAIAAHRAPAGAVPALRKDPGGGPLSPSLLKHADPQTVVGLAAALAAARAGGLDLSGFADWAVVACPCSLGRPAFEGSWPKFVAEGAWGVSPHLIPHNSLHSMPGVLSQVLKAHGPNLGVGGSPGGESDAFLAAAALLDDPSVAGVWLVFSGRSLDEETGRDDATEALALALTAARPGHAGPRLLYSPAGGIEFLPVPTGDPDPGLSWLPSGPGLLRKDAPEPAGPRPRAVPSAEDAREDRR